MVANKASYPRGGRQACSRKALMSLKSMCRHSLPGDLSTGTFLTRVAHYLYLLQRWCLAPCTKGLEGGPPAKLTRREGTETPREGVLCPLVLTRSKAGAGQQLNSSL
jgi:hypothetical protein